MTLKESAEHQREDVVLKGWMSRPVLTVIDPVNVAGGMPLFIVLCEFLHVLDDPV